jgi:WD40 repeat protein
VEQGQFLVPEAHAYSEIQLRVTDAGDGRYSLLTIGHDESTTTSTFELPFGDMELENFLLKIGAARRAVRSYSDTRMNEARLFGERLFDAVFTSEVHEIFRTSLQFVQGKDNHGLRIKLYLSEAPGLLDIPWEFLYDDRRFLAHSVETPVVRALDLSSTRRPSEVSLPLRILAMDSQPTGIPRLASDQERQKLEEALAPLRKAGYVDLQWLEQATLPALQRRIDEPDDIHVFHYIGHGTYDEDEDVGLLLFEDEGGGPRGVTGAELGGLLYGESSLRLAVLNTCEGARGSRHDPFSGVAASLIGAKIPAVVGMQFEVTDTAAIAFADQLYRSIADGLPIDAAVGYARRAVWAQSGVEFGTPVLFLGSTPTQLFDVDLSSVPEEEPPRPAAAEAPPVREEPRAVDLPQPPGPAVAVAASEGNLAQLEEGLAQLGGSTHDSQRNALRSLAAEGVAEGESLLGICRCCGYKDLARNVLLVWTSNRLLWARKPTFSNVSSGAIDWSKVSSVEDGAGAYGTPGLRIRTRIGDEIAVNDFRGEGVSLSAISLDFSVEGVRSKARELAPSGDRHGPAGPAAEVVAAVWHDDAVTSLAVSPDGRRLATSSSDGTARVWELHDLKQALLMRHDNDVTSVAFSPDGTQLATASHDKTARVWRLDDGQEAIRFPEKGWMTKLKAVALGAGGSLLATGSTSNVARVFELPEGNELVALGHPNWVLAVAISPDGSRLASGCYDKRVRIWDLPSGEEVAEMCHAKPVTSVVFSVDGERLATSSDDGTARLWQLPGGTELTSVEHDGQRRGIADVALSPDEQTLATAGEDGTARLWDISASHETARLKHEGGVTGVAFDREGAHLVTASKDSRIRLWRLPGG